MLDRIRRFDHKNPEHTNALLFWSCFAVVVVILVKFAQVLWTGKPFVGNVSFQIGQEIIVLPAAFWTAKIALWYLAFQHGMYVARARGVNVHSALDLGTTLAPIIIIVVAAFTIWGTSYDETGKLHEWFGLAVFNSNTAQAAIWFAGVAIADLKLHFLKREAAPAADAETATGSERSEDADERPGPYMGFVSQLGGSTINLNGEYSISLGMDGFIDVDAPLSEAQVLKIFADELVRRGSTTPALAAPPAAA